GVDEIDAEAPSLAEVAQRDHVPLEVTAGDSEGRTNVRRRSDSWIESQSRHHFRPVGSDRLAEVGHGVGVRHAGTEVEVDGHLGHLRALVAHPEHGTPEVPYGGVEIGRKRPAGLLTAQDDALRLQVALDGPTEDQRLHPVVESDIEIGALCLDPVCQGAHEAWRYLAHDRQGYSVPEKRDGGIEKSRHGRE